MLIHFIQKYIQLINAINELIGRVIGWLTTSLVLLVCFNVLARYAFGFSSASIDELQWHLFALVFLLGAAFTLKNDRHVRVDVFYAKFSKKKKAWINLLGSFFFLLPFCLLVIKGSIPYFLVSLQLNERSADPSGLPALYIIKSAIGVSFVLLFLQGLSLFFASFLSILGKDVPHSK